MNTIDFSHLVFADQGLNVPRYVQGKEFDHSRVDAKPIIREIKIRPVKAKRVEKPRPERYSKRKAWVLQQRRNVGKIITQMRLDAGFDAPLRLPIWDV